MGCNLYSQGSEEKEVGMADNFKIESKKIWIPLQGIQISDDQLKIGCLQRIADSLEKMEAPYLRLIGDVESLTRCREELIAETEHLSRCNSNLRGAITRLKKRK